MKFSRKMKTIKYNLIFVLLFFSLNASTQTIRTDVLVIGGESMGVGAGIQAANSGVKTLIVEQSAELGKDITNIDTSRKIGLYEKFHTHLKGNKNYSEVLKAWTDTVKNLNVISNTQVKSLKKSGKRWKVQLSNGTKVKAKVVFDAMGNKFATKSGDSIRDILVTNTPDYYYQGNLYRTFVGFWPLEMFILPDKENFLSITSGRFSEGQAAGATAAYCAFFGTTTKNLDVRVIQGELLAYKAELMRLNDVPQTDSNYLAIQRIAVTGIIKGYFFLPGGFLFHPEKQVKLNDIEPAFREYYSRSQIWFADNSVDTFTIADALILIKFIGSRGEELNREVEKGWKTSFKFKNAFDLKRAITRREFAVLVDTYLKPFNVKVDLTGRLIQ